MVFATKTSVADTQPISLRLILPRHKNLLPIASIVLSESAPLSKEKLTFCYCATINALHAYLNAEYTKFDPITTTNCCHGMALHIRDLIIDISSINVEHILNKLEHNYSLLKNSVTENTEHISPKESYLPQQIISLAQLYILSLVQEQDLERGGGHTNTQKLKEISPVSSKFCDKIVKKLQLYFSNLIVDGYSSRLNLMKQDFPINNAPVSLWGKYVQASYIRQDRRNRKYASCLYSMQIILAHLILNRVKIAFVNDLKCENGKYKKGRYIRLLEGDGVGNFRIIDTEGTKFDAFDTRTPIVVFAGSTHSKNFTLPSFSCHITTWLSRFPSLVLACDTFYPQFPAVYDDPNFNSDPIAPEEDDLREIIDNHKKTEGVAAHDPSLFCLTHIYSASLLQINRAIRGDSTALLSSFIPLRLANSNKIKRTELS